MTTCYVSIGSNLERETNIIAALQSLQQQFGYLTCSSIYESAAVGFDGPSFYNLVTAFDSDLPASELADRLRQIEHLLGRQRNCQKFSSRNIDLDLILYGDAIIDTPQLRIPRNDVTRYAFVLEPLAEIAPQQRHPLNNLSYVELWQQFNKTGIQQNQLQPEWLNAFIG